MSKTIAYHDSGRAVLLAVLVALSAIAASATLAGSAAAQDHEVEIEFGDETAETGDDVTVDLGLAAAQSDEASIAGYSVVMSFDPEVLAFVGVEGEEFADPTVNDENADEGDVVLEASQGDDPDETPLEAATVSFEVVGDAGDVSDVGFQSAAVMDDGPSEYDLETTDGSVTVLGDGVEEPAVYEVSDVDPSSETVEPGEAVDVEATVSNTGDVPGEKAVELHLDGETVATEAAVEVDDGDSEAVAFENVTVPDDEGDYEYAVWTEDDEATATVTVEAESDNPPVSPPSPPEDPTPADISVTDAALSSEEIDEGDAVEVEATLENAGEEAGTATVELVVDGTVVTEETVSVDGEATTTVAFTESFDEAGEYDIAVDDVEAGTLSVVSSASPEPAEIAVTDADLDAAELETDEAVEITATLENTGDESGTHAAELIVDGTVVDDESVSVDGEATATVTFTESFDEAGEYDIAVDDVEAGTVSVGDDGDDDDGTPGFGGALAAIAMLSAAVLFARIR